MYSPPEDKLRSSVSSHFRGWDYFGHGAADINIITNIMLSCLHDRWNRLLVDLSEHTRPGRWLSLAKLREAAAAVHRKGRLANVWGFIDGAAKQISGHKRQHVQKFQTVMTPFGIMVPFYGPVEGQRHDARIFRMSGLLIQVAQHIPQHGPNPCDVFVLYGDSAYPLRLHLQAPFGGAHLTVAESDFNTEIRKSRICVEWGFCDISAKLGIVDYKRNQQLFPYLFLSLLSAFIKSLTSAWHRSRHKRVQNVLPPELRLVATESQMRLPLSKGYL